VLRGLESGGLALPSVRNYEGERIHCLREGGHTNAVSVLQLAPNEKSVLSGSWDKSVLDWDLNNGQIIRRFDGSAGQISAIELRPSSGNPIPAEASDPDIKSDTLDSNNSKPLPNGFFANGSAADGAGPLGKPAGDAGGQASDDGSLFGSPAGSLFGDDNDTMGGGGGGGAFGNDDDDEFSRAMDMGDHPGDFPMGDTDMPNAPPDGASGLAPAPDGDTSLANGSGTQEMLDSSQAPADTQQDASSADAQIKEQFVDAPPQPTHPANASPTRGLNDSGPPGHQDATQMSPDIFLSAAMDGNIRIWDRRVPDPVARIGNRRGVPPWCMGACWSPDGNWIYAGRRNGTVEEFSIHNARSGWQPERVLKFPAGSGAVSCVRPMPNGRHLVCASHDILRLYDLRDNAAFKHSRVPFIIIPGPPRAGVISNLYIDPTSRIMISAAGTRGWDGTSTEVLIGYEIGVSK
jgi:transcriptional activator SPT8